MAGALRLSDAAIRAAKPGEKPRKLTDGGGLHLLVTPAGGRLWRFQYRHGGKQRMLSIGRYGDPQRDPGSIGLADARRAMNAARALLAAGQDPAARKQAAKAAHAVKVGNTFDALADEFLDLIRREGAAQRTIWKTTWLLDLARPALGARPIAEVGATDVLAVLRVVEGRGHLESARRLRSTLSRVFRLAVASDRAGGDPTVALGGAIAAPKVRNRAAIIDPERFGELMRAVRGYENPLVRAAIELLALTAVRPGELRLARWDEFDLDAALWSVPAGRMKMRRPHIVPLSRQAVAILRDLREVTATAGFLIPGVRSDEEPLSEGTLTAALRRMGFPAAEHVPHGFRSSFATMTSEAGGDPDVIEAALAHEVAGKVRRVYVRAGWMEQRRTLLQDWADRVDRMREGGSILPLRKSTRKLAGRGVNGG